MQPVPEQILHQSLAQLDLECLDQPALRHIEHQQRTGDDEEHAELNTGSRGYRGATAHRRTACSSY